MFCIMICVAFLIQMVTGDTLVARYVAIQNGCHMEFIIMSYQEISPYINSSYISGSFHTSGQFTRGNMHFHFIDCATDYFLCTFSHLIRCVTIQSLSLVCFSLTAICCFTTLSSH